MEQCVTGWESDQGSHMGQRPVVWAEALTGTSAPSEERGGAQSHGEAGVGWTPGQFSSGVTYLGGRERESIS